VSFAIIVAADEANGIGKDGGLPWHLPGDMAFYKRTTLSAPEGKRNAVIMGRKTYDSIPAKFRPLKDRINIVLSRAEGYAADAGVLTAHSLDEALRTAATLPALHRVFVIGGGELYREALGRPDCREVLLTRVHARFASDTHLAEFAHAFERTRADGPQRDGDVTYTWETYERRR
jgi:dihydrofolate reductase